ncbi:hypothetical protein AVEN_206155-1 [Araneus ventricosus]|uniref:Uncharacterized protein n=1 Tax=Araneus ventricosus TaxID=182803 RepID=A0A4Y2N2S0_ARAVE|nr:hypothetical protein AVEN_206155-1 [Araneus ventricosus]
MQQQPKSQGTTRDSRGREVDPEHYSLMNKEKSQAAVANTSSGRPVKQEIAEDDAFEVLHCDDKAPTQCQLTNAEICSMVLMNSQPSVSDSEESEQETQVEDKIPIDSFVEVLNTAIKGLEQRDFISKSDIMAIHKIKEKLLNQKPKLMKQLTLN